MRNALARSQDSLRMPANFTAPELANFIAAQAVAVATSYLDGRSANASLARAADCLTCELQMVGDEPQCNEIVDPTRMLVVAMTQISIANGERAGCWADIMTALISLLRKRSLQMRVGSLPGDHARHDAASDNKGILLEVLCQ